MTTGNYKRTSVGGKTFYNLEGDNVVLMNDGDNIIFTKRDKEDKVVSSFKIDKAILKALILEGLVLIQKKDEKE